MHVAADRDHADARVVAAQSVHALERERPQPERRRVAVLRQPAERHRVVRDELRVRVVVLLLLGGLGRVGLHWPLRVAVSTRRAISHTLAA